MFAFARRQVERERMIPANCSKASTALLKRFLVPEARIPQGQQYATRLRLRNQPDRVSPTARVRPERHVAPTALATALAPVRDTIRRTSHSQCFLPISRYMAPLPGSPTNLRIDTDSPGHPTCFQRGCVGRALSPPPARLTRHTRRSEGPRCGSRTGLSAPKNTTWANFDQYALSGFCLTSSRVPNLAGKSLRIDPRWMVNERLILFLRKNGRSCSASAAGKGDAMGYSSPKKPFDLKEFLSKPGVARKRRNPWLRTAPSSVGKAESAESKADPAPSKPS